MSAHRPSFPRRLAPPRAAGRRRDSHDDDRVFLVPAGDGWALVTRGGTTVVSGSGRAGRRRCLEFARAQGILAVLS
jgi:hypothetical protein